MALGALGWVGISLLAFWAACIPAAFLVNNRTDSDAGIVVATFAGFAGGAGIVCLLTALG